MAKKVTTLKKKINIKKNNSNTSKKALNKKVKLGKFEKFDLAEKEIKEAEDAVQDLGSELSEGEARNLVTRAAMDLEKAQVEIEEADEHSF